MSSEDNIKIEAFDHHIRQKVCQTRSPYRRGRKERAVKVLTISDESKYLLIQRVPDIKSDVKQDLRQLCQRFGEIERLESTDYPNCEDFTKTYLIKYKVFVNAIKAKKSLDDYNFFGSILHVCYAPELETIDETRHKLDLRKRYVPRVYHKKPELSQTSEPIFDEEVEEVNHNCHINPNIKETEKRGPDLKRMFSQLINDLNETDSQKQLETKKLKITPKIRWRTQTNSSGLTNRSAHESTQPQKSP